MKAFRGIAGGRGRQAAALALAAVILGGPLAFAAAAGLAAAAALRDETARLSAEAAAFRALAGRTAAFAALAAERRAAIAAAGLTLPGSGEAEALAALQARLGSLADQAGVEIARLSPGIVTADEIGIGIELEADPAGAFALVAAIENGKPLLLIDRLDLVRLGRPGEPGRLRLELELRAFRATAELPE